MNGSKNNRRGARVGGAEERGPPHGTIKSRSAHPINLAALDAMMAEAPKELVSCSSVEVLSEGGTIDGSADLCLHPLEHADALLAAQEAHGPRHGIRAFQDASKGGRRHVLMMPVNALVNGLNNFSMDDPLLEGWMGISPAELARYMLWSGYDTLLLQQVPVIQATSTLSRWKMLEGFTEAFARAWEREATVFLGNGERLMEESRNGLRVSAPRRAGNGDSSEQPDNALIEFGTKSGAISPKVAAGPLSWPPTASPMNGSVFHPRGTEVSESPLPRRKTTTTVNPMMQALKVGMLAGAGGADPDGATRGHPVYWPVFIRVQTANVLVENGDAFVHHAFVSRDVDHPWWYSIKGIVMRNRHLDVKGLYSHSYASDVYKSRTQIVTYIENYVEDETADELEGIIRTKKSLWGLSTGTSTNLGRGRRLSMFAIEEVDASVNIDPIDPPAAFRRVVVGEEFTEADVLLPRPFSSVDIGHFLTVMQTKSIPSLVCFSLPPVLKDVVVFRGKQEPISMVQYFSHPVFAEYEPNMPRVAMAGRARPDRTSIPHSVSSVSLTAGRGKGVRWADQQIVKQENKVLDALACPNLEAFLDEVAHERQRTGAADWSAEGEEESDWIEAIVEQLRRAKKTASAIAKVKKAVSAKAEAEQANASGAGQGHSEEGEGEGEEEPLRDVPEWVTQQLPDLLRLLEACRLLANDPTLLRSMVDAGERVSKRRKGDNNTNTPGATPSRSQPNTPNRSRPGTPNRNSISKHNTPSASGLRTPGGREIDEDEEELLRTYEEEALPLHWTDVEKLGKSDTLYDTEDGPELLEDQLLSAYLEYSVGQPRLGTRSSSRAEEIVLNNAQFLVDSGSLTPIHFETARCGPVKSDLFRSILAKFSALAIMLQSSRQSGQDSKEGPADTKEEKDIKAAVHAMLCWVSVNQVYACMSAVARAGGADPHDHSKSTSNSATGPSQIEVYVVEKQVLTFTGPAENEEHYAFHAVYKKTSKGLAVYVTKEHKNQAAAVLWCYLKVLGVPVMICHLAECLMDRALDCRWDTTASEEVFKGAAVEEGAMRLGYVGGLRPLSFLSETCKEDIEEMPIMEKACLLRMLAHGHGCIAEYSSGGPGVARSRSELAASFRIVSTWRMSIVNNLRTMESSRYLNKFEDNLRLPRLTIGGTAIGHRGADPRRVVWWTWLAVPWSPSARGAVTNLLTVIARAPPPRVSAAQAAENTPLSKSTKRKNARGQDAPPPGGAALSGLPGHGAVWRMISDLMVTKLSTGMLVRSLVLENRDESPYPPFEKHYHMVALELRGADKTAVFSFLRTDAGMLGEVLNRLVREDCLAADHSAAFLASKTLGTLHNVKHGKSANTPVWLKTGFGGRLTRLRDYLTTPKDSPVLHGYSVGMYYSMPVLIELLLQITSGSKSSIYTNSALGQGEVKYETVVPMALLHSLVIFGGLSLGAAKISSVNFFSFMVIKLVLAQIQFVAVLIVASVVLLPFIAGAAVLLWWDELLLAATFVGVFFFVGIYIMLVSLMLSTTGGKPWSSSSGRCLLLAHSLLLVSPVLTELGIIPRSWGSQSFVTGVAALLLTLIVGFTVNVRRLYNMTLSKQPLTLSAEEWKEWQDEHKDHADPTALFYKRASSMLTAWRHRLTRKRRYRMLDEDLEQFLLGFDAIRNAQAVPPRWSPQWDERLKRGHEALVAVNRGAGVETASTMWAVVKWDVIYGASYFLMVFSDNLVSIWTDKQIVESDNINMLALALFIIATAGLESMMMVNLGRANGWRFWRMDPEVLSMSDASEAVGNALHRLYLWDFATYGCFVLLCTLGVWCLGYFWIIANYNWSLRDALRATSLVVGYLGILLGLFHKILFGGSISRQRAAVQVSTVALAAGYGLGLGLVAANRYLRFSEESLAYATVGFTGFFYAVFSMRIYREFRVQLTSQGFASGQLLSTPSLGTAGQRCLGVSTLHLDAMEARAAECCRAASGGRVLTHQENRELIRRTLFADGKADPTTLWAEAPRSLQSAFGDKVPRNEDFFRWTIAPVPDRCILDHGLNALVDPEQDDLLYVAESVYGDRQSFMECLMHETYEWAYGSHQVGVLAELLRDPLPARMRRQLASPETHLAKVVDRTLPCTVDTISLGCLKNEIYWRDLSPHARELILRMVLTQPPIYFRHLENQDTENWQMSFAIEDDGGPEPSDSTLDPQSDLALAMRLGCRTGNVLLAAMEEASLGLEPQEVVARASLLSGLSQCVMRYALAHISVGNPSTSTRGPPGVSLEPATSVGHLAGRQRVAVAVAQLGRAAISKSKRYGRLSNVESILGQVETVFPPRGAFHLDYMLFGAASGCMGFDREAFALMVDQNPWSLPLFIRMHRTSHWLYKKLLHHIVLKTDVLISDLMKTLKATDVDADGFADQHRDSGSARAAQGAAARHTSRGQDPERGNWLIEQRRQLERMIRDQDLPIAFSQWLDQMLLRRDPLLADYWEARDAGDFSEALVSLKLVEGGLKGLLETGIPAGLSTYADLATFAKCGSTIGMMRAPRDQEGNADSGAGAGSRSGNKRFGGGGGGTLPSRIKADGGVCVVAMDSGTWPLYGGGVAVCRKQLLDDTVGRVRWNALFEVALPAPLPNTVETPENIRQILPIPLWSQNAGGSYETFLAHTSFVTRALRETRTTNEAINSFFIPQLKTLIDLANTPGESVSIGGLEVAAQAIAEIYAYFEVFDWETTWKAGTTHDHWAASWLACAARDKQARPLLNSERPNLAELHEILNYWQTLLTCLQVQLPEMNADNRGVIHVSHHGTQALVGIAAKRLCGWGLVVWDHGMLWRERCKAIAELHSSSLFVRKSLISLHRLVAKVALYEADTLTPCTQMNKPWEMRCVAERDSEVRDIVSRKVNPVLNGAPASIQPNDFLPGLNADGKNEWVTVVMLSHVYALKGVMTAIQAADVIVHRYGMKRFRLLIYGSTTHDVVYCRRCQDAIERLKLTENVWLKGKGKPAAVLAQGDMFLNSSVSEGLPLAIIEASRAGLVVVATDVGGTRDVVGEFGGICMPNSPMPLAKTMLETLAACKKWCKIGGAPDLAWRDIDLSPNPGEVLEKAIFDKDVINARHDWGTRYLEWTSKAFTLERYRDEHVRALWYADRQAMSNCARLSLDWGANPGQKRLALSYLRLRRLLDVSDRKEHTNVGFMSDIREARARIKSEQKSREPIEISTDHHQLVQMAHFQTSTSDLPVLQWLHGGKNEAVGEWDPRMYRSNDSDSLLSVGGQSAHSSALGALQRIDEGEGEHTDADAAAAKDPEVSFADVRVHKGVATVAAAEAKGEVSQQWQKNKEKGTGKGKGLSLAERAEGGNSPTPVSRRRKKWHNDDDGDGGGGGDADVAVKDSPARDNDLTYSDDSIDGGGGAEVAADIKQKLEKLQLFEELDRRLVERAGVHLADVSQYSSPTLSRILAETAESPSSASTASRSVQKHDHHQRQQRQQNPQQPSDISRGPSPLCPASGQEAAAAVALAAAAAEPPTPPALFVPHSSHHEDSGYAGDRWDGADSPAGSRFSASMLGDPRGGGDDGGGNPSRLNSLASSPLLADAYASLKEGGSHGSSTVGVSAAAAGRVGGRYDNDEAANRFDAAGAPFGVSTARGWASSPINSANGGGGAGRMWGDREGGRQKLAADFDEQEQRMRHVHRHRPGSGHHPSPAERASSSSAGPSGIAPRLDADSAIAISDAVMLRGSNAGGRRDRSFSRPGAPQQQTRPSRLSKIGTIMHPREVEQPSPGPVSEEVRRQRASKRNHMIKAMATHQALSAASGSSAFSSNTSSASPGNYVAGAGGGGGGGGGGSSSSREERGWRRRSTPPEMERPLPYADDVFAQPGAAERGIKRFEVGAASGPPSKPVNSVKIQVKRKPPIQAADGFAAEDSAEDDSDDAHSTHSFVSAGSFRRP